MVGVMDSWAGLMTQVLVGDHGRVGDMRSGGWRAIPMVQQMMLAAPRSEEEHVCRGENLVCLWLDR